MKISTLAAVCDGERIRKVEPHGMANKCSPIMGERRRRFPIALRNTADRSEKETSNG
jgi:hypothetical protein